MKRATSALAGLAAATVALAQQTPPPTSAEPRASTTPREQRAATSADSASRAARPTYNTGHGIFVRDGKLYDSNGIEFRIRGVNLWHYDSTEHSGPGIARSNANAVRVPLDLASVPRAKFASMVQRYLSEREVVIPTMFAVPGSRKPLGGSESTADLAAAVEDWVTNFGYYAAMEHHLIINVANEWGPRASETWALANEKAIARLREVGYRVPIMIDTGGWGQDTGDLLRYAKLVFDSDPQRNVIFSFHVYRGLGDGWTPTTLNAFALQLKALSASAGMVFVFGEFGPGRYIGPSPTMLTPQQVIRAAEAAGIGWMGWAWDFNNLPDGASNDNGFSMTLHGPGIYVVPADLTTYGKEMVLSNYALARAQKATDF